MTTIRREDQEWHDPDEHVAAILRGVYGAEFAGKDR